MRNWIFAFFVVLTACVAPAIADEGGKEKKMLDGSDELELDVRRQDGVDKRLKGWGGFQPVDPITKSGFSVAADFTRGKGAGQYTIQFSVVDPNDPSNFWNINTKAKITWSVQGVPIVRKISVFNGMSITGDGESVTVEVIDASAVALPPNPQPQKYNVGVTIAPGNRGTDTNPPFLLDFENGGPITVATGLTFDVTIPQGIGIKSVMITMSAQPGNPILEGQAYVRQLTAPAAGIILTQYDPRTFQWFPIIPGAKTLRLVNNSGHNVEFCVIWGIDG